MTGQRTSIPPTIADYTLRTLHPETQGGRSLDLGDDARQAGSGRAQAVELGKRKGISGKDDGEEEGEEAEDVKDMDKDGDDEEADEISDAEEGGEEPVWRKVLIGHTRRIPVAMLESAGIDNLIKHAKDCPIDARSEAAFKSARYMQEQEALYLAAHPCEGLPCLRSDFVFDPNYHPDPMRAHEPVKCDTLDKFAGMFQEEMDSDDSISDISDPMVIDPTPKAAAPTHPDEPPLPVPSPAATLHSDSDCDLDTSILG